MSDPIDSRTLWELHLAVARNARARGDGPAAERSMRSAHAHAAARQIIKRMSARKGVDTHHKAA